MMRQSAVVLAVCLIGLQPTHCSQSWFGPLDDASCNVEAVEDANNLQLKSILSEIMNSTYFRLFRVNLNRECKFWKDEEEEPECETKVFAEPACSLDMPAAAHSFDWESQTSPVDRTLDQTEAAEAVASDEDCEDPSFWLDMCSNIPTDSPEFVNLQLNPERWTGYNGSHVWGAIYQENCFKNAKDAKEDNMCYEERVLYRLLSAMHATTNIHINLHYHPPKKDKQGVWTPNPSRFMKQYGTHPEFLKNLHFGFVVTLRALRKAAPFLYDFDYSMATDVADPAEASRTQMLVRRLLDSHILESCSSVFDAFDESLLFQPPAGASTASTIKRDFKNVFRNISSVLDCVTCQKCKLHAKVQLLGLGTSLKILLLPSHLLPTSVTRDEMVALFNTIGSFSEAIDGATTLSKLYLDDFNAYKKKQAPLDSSSAPPSPINPIKAAPVPVPQGLRSKEVMHNMGLVDVAMGTVAAGGAARFLDQAQEEQLLDLVLAHDAHILLLAKYYSDASRFSRHALRYLGSASAAASGYSAEVAVDVVVIGGGLAGLSAAVSLLDRGMRVVLLDKEKYYGGNSAKASSGINAVDPGNEFGDTIDIYRNDTLAGGHGEAGNTALVDRLVEGSGDALAWLRERVGLKLTDTCQMGGHSKVRTYRPPKGMAGSEMILALQRIVKKADPNQLTNMKGAAAKELLQDSEGRVTGVRVQTTEGQQDVLSRHVIVATGGYGADRSPDSLLAQHRPELISYPTTNGPFATGDGHKLAQAAGAKLMQMDDVQVHPTGFLNPAKPDAPTKMLCAELLRAVGGVLLDSRGQRFSNELGPRDYVVGRMKATEPELMQFKLVLTEDQAVFAPAHVPFYTTKGLLQKFDSLDDVAKWMEVPPAILRATFQGYNADAANTSDAFGKQFFKNTPMNLAGSFYAGTVVPVIHYCMGGIAIDPEGRVLGEEGQGVVPGLWAAGEVVGGIHGSNRLGGNALTECVVFGRAVAAAVPARATETTAPATTQQQQQEEVEEQEEAWQERVVSLKELQAHDGLEGRAVWINLYDRVYDFTDFAEEHPGGIEAVTDYAGQNATKVFLNVHSEEMLEDFVPLGRMTPA